jgi:hypothetical protein
VFISQRKTPSLFRTTKLANTWFEYGMREGGAKNQHFPFSSYEEDKMTAAEVSMTQSLVCSMG